MSPDLIAFLKAWYDWATSGAPEGEPFRRMHGLCVNTARFPVSDGDSFRLFREVSDAVGDDAWPFGGEDEYDTRELNKTQHECPKRLAWVRERLIEAGELVA